MRSKALDKYFTNMEPRSFFGVFFGALGNLEVHSDEMKGPNFFCDVKLED